jgi:hypothetical protein
MPTQTTIPAAELRRHLDLLVAERAYIRLEEFEDPLYEADLDAEILALRSAYVGAAVTEIASLRSQLSGPLEG